MTTVAITRFPTAPAVPVTRLRLTLRGRRVIAGLVALPIGIALGAAVLSSGSALASDSTSETPTAFETVTAVPGDTLWSIAEDVAPTADPRDVVHGIMVLNGLRGAGIDAGQQIAIPLEYTLGR